MIRIRKFKDQPDPLHWWVKLVTFAPSSVLDFWKIKFEKSTWIYNLQKSISKSIFAGHTGNKNQVRTRQKIKFVLKLIFFEFVINSQIDISKIKHRMIDTVSVGLNLAEWRTFMIMILKKWHFWNCVSPNNSNFPIWF